MARVQLTGFAEYIDKLDRLTDKTEGIMKQALFVGAGKIADSVRSGIGGVPVDDEYANGHDKRSGIRSDQKDELESGLGIAKMETKNGSVDTRVGFRMGAAQIARKVESGTSYMVKHPFIRQACNSARQSAIEEMKRVFEEETQKIMK